MELKGRLRIVARRWFNKRTGTIYHSCEVQHDGDLVERNTALGGGDQYLQTALSILQKHGLCEVNEERVGGMRKDATAFLDWLRGNQERVEVLCFDVPKKRELNRG
jgi:hypothetical protein